MTSKKKELLLQQLEYFKSLQIVRNNNLYGVKREDGSMAVSPDYKDAGIYLRINKFFPSLMRPVVWVVNDFNKEAYIGPELENNAKFKSYTALIGNSSGNGLIGFLRALRDDMLYDDIPISQVEPEQVLTYSKKKSA